MLNLPKSTDLNRLIPKEKLTKKLTLSPALKVSLKDNISKITIKNELSPKTMNIARGKSVPAVFVVEIQLKQKEADYKLVEALAKQIGQTLVFVLRYDNVGQLAIYRNKLYHSDWMNYAVLTLDISGADFDVVWDGIVGQIALEKETDSAPKWTISVDEQLARQEQRKKLEREIATLERKIKKETQFNLQVKMKRELAKLRERLT